LHRIVARPAVYDAIQRIAGLEQTRKHLRPFLRSADGLVVDIGAGTGNFFDLLPLPGLYVWFDNDPVKLKGFKKKHSAALAVLGDASRMPIRDKSVDLALCVAVSHHLTDAELDGFLADAARISRRGLIFVDATRHPHSLVSWLLWKYDRGSNPRPVAQLRGMIQRHFNIELEECYRTFHRFFLCVATPTRDSSRTEPTPADNHSGFPTKPSTVP
jgi:SAM-dependent methyltransferase